MARRQGSDVSIPYYVDDACDLAVLACLLLSYKTENITVKIGFVEHEDE
jgi:hypothetical protein